MAHVWPSYTVQLRPRNITAPPGRTTVASRNNRSGGGGIGPPGWRFPSPATIRFHRRPGDAAGAFGRPGPTVAVVRPAAAQINERRRHFPTVSGRRAENGEG